VQPIFTWIIIIPLASSIKIIIGKIVFLGNLIIAIYQYIYIKFCVQKWQLTPIAIIIMANASLEIANI
jgi:hypothetical protein